MYPFRPCPRGTVCPNCLKPREQNPRSRSIAAVASCRPFPSTSAGFPLHLPKGRKVSISRDDSSATGDGVGGGVRGGNELGSGEAGGRGPVPPTPCLVSRTPGCAVARGEGGAIADVVGCVPRADDWCGDYMASTCERRMMVGPSWFELKTSPGAAVAGCYMQLPSISLLATQGWMFTPKLSMKSIVVYHGYLTHP